VEHGQSSTRVGGIDVGKHRLDVAIHGLEDETQAAQDARLLIDLPLRPAAHRGLWTT